MKPRQFRREPHRTGDGTTHDYRLRCGTCGCFGTLGGAFQFGAATAADVVPKKFAAKGWFVGKRQNGADDRCPACVNREAEARRKKIHIVPAEEAPPVSQPKPLPIAFPAKPAAAASPPRAMSRDERRLIWAKLEDVYLDERSGFTAGWDDERVATDLGVPRAWISTIREENFGPDVSVDLEKILLEASEYLKGYEGLQEEIERCRGLCEKAGIDFNKASSDLRALKPRVEAAAKRVAEIGERLKRCDRSRGAA